MDIKKALYISQEISPYLPSSVLADMGRNLPQGIQEKGIEVRTFMPKYGSINERRNQLHEVIRLSGLNIVIDDTDHPLIIKVATLQPTRMQVYFIDNDDYFHRQGSEGLEIDTEPEENDERIMFFVRGVIETVKKLRWLPQIVHCSGWATALAPLYIRRMYQDDPTLRECKIIYSIHNASPVQALDPRMAEKLEMDGFDKQDLAHLTNGDIDEVALGKLAIDFSDAVVQAEQDVNPELVAYAKASGKPFLEYPGEENFIDKYHEFYLSL
jgi:starch synthase